MYTKRTVCFGHQLVFKSKFMIGFAISHKSSFLFKLERELLKVKQIYL